MIFASLNTEFQRDEGREKKKKKINANHLPFLGRPFNRDNGQRAHER